MIAWALGCGVAVGVLLVSIARERAVLGALAKITASACMVAAALTSGALEHPAGRLFALGLLLSAVGDVCLIGRGRAAFLGGLVSFALAHVAYVFASLALGVGRGTSIAAAVVLSVVALRVWRWLSPHVPKAMRWPVRGYIVVITAMVACALGAWSHGAPVGLALGATLFFLSDLAVARERFVVTSTLNRLWGLPAYYAGQLLIAGAAAAPAILVVA